MSLKVWLPLDGDLRNLGASDAIVTNSSATVNTTGKIGSCYSFAKNAYLDINKETMQNFSNAVSICFWIKINSWNTNWDTIFQAGKGSTAWTQYHIGILRNSANYLCWTLGNGSTTSNSNYRTGNITLGEWTHVTCTYGEEKWATYLNGILSNSGTTTIVPNFSNITSIKIGGLAGNYKCDCLLNDFRIYDHCLSAAEVKEIAQGLVVHYKLDNTPEGNLIINGFGELGTENWSNSSRISSDVPSENTNIKQSFYNQTTIEKIFIIPSHTYQFSCYVKSTGTSGYTYPSFDPYDIDKLFINNYNTPDGFQSATRTTLAQALNPGDTKIYATSLASWPTHTNNRYVAIFSYKDSTGHLYNDWEYTRNIRAYGTSDNLDKTNNIITLSSAYNGPAIPAGTSICQTVGGSTYWYPVGAITKASVSEWTLKTRTFVPQNINRLKSAHYLVYRADWANDVLHAGIELIDLNYSSNIIQDSSGYGHNGIINSSPTISSNTARYSSSMFFDGVDDCIKIPFNDVIKDKNYTISVWTYKTSIGTKNYQTILGGPSGFELEARSSSSTSPLYRIHNWGGGTTPYEFNRWNLFTFVHTDNDSKLYVNGELKITGNSANIPTGDYYIGAWKTATSQNYEGQMSDFRIYCTPLLDTDIKLLYNIGMRVDNLGGVHAFEFEETSSSKNKLTKTGILNNNIIEPYLTLPDGSNWKLMLYHYVDNGNNLFTSSNATYCNDFGLYSRLRDINNYTYNGKYEFYVIQDGKEFRWTQTSQPTASSIAGLTVIEGYNNPVNGLAKANQSNTYIGYGSWWGACGCWTKYSTGGKTGIPGFGSHNGDGICEKYLALYVRVEKNNASFENSSSNSTEFIEL